MTTPYASFTNETIEDDINWYYKYDPDNEGYLALLWAEFDARMLDGRIEKW